MESGKDLSESARPGESGKVNVVVNEDKKFSHSQSDSESLENLENEVVEESHSSDAGVDSIEGVIPEFTFETRKVCEHASILPNLLMMVTRISWIFLILRWLLVRS